MVYLSLVEKLEDLKVGLNNDTHIDVILQSLPPFYDPFIINFNMNGLEESIIELINMLVRYVVATKKSTSSVLVVEALTSKAKGKRAGRWKRKKGKAKANIVVAAKDAKSALIAPVGMSKCYKEAEEEVVLRFGDSKAVVAEAVGIVNLVISDPVKLELKDCYFVLLDNAGFEFLINKNYFYLMKEGSSHLLGHIPQDSIKRLVDSKSLEIDNLDNLPAYFCGPLNTHARGGFSYFITCTNDYSWYGYVNLMKYKSEVFVRFKEFRLEENGIVSQWTPPVMPQLNGVAKRRNQTLLNMVWSMMSFTELLLSFWGYALEMAASEAPQSSAGTSSAPTVSTDNVPVLRRSARVPQPPESDSGKWLEAMKSKMDSMSLNHVWMLMDRPMGVKPVGCKWVYKHKICADGEVTSFKPRLVTKGYTQRPEVDFEKIFSPVAMAKSIQIMLAIATWYDYDIQLMDVKITFFNGFVEEEINMDQS
ncbi:UNVERIFIED_CONTAM: hypothetical protein Scaly_2779200 [Sesamum calycinum]|uniref:Reverse transcriptase Ty1/copia-type domain-containing protein n=1 Tax=Sesamum calycinum TaxID=2727403 RepID=A0AAW2IZY3_9LAMI